MTYSELQDSAIFLWKMPPPEGTEIQRIEFYHGADNHHYMVQVLEGGYPPAIFKQTRSC